MDFSSEMHQQYLKDFIHSLQSGSEDSINDQLQSHSRCLSVSSLNPNAAEFVPSSMKINDSNNHDEDDPWVSSTTTLVNNVTDGDGLHVNNEDAQSRIQRQLFYLMNQLGKQHLTLAEMHFSVTPNGQGINVQFMPQACGHRYPLDENLCKAAGLRLDVGDFGLQSTQLGNDLAAQFLSRMGQVLNLKPDEQQLCPKCIAMPRRSSYSDLEIERQIEDIKGFERLINEDADTRYQEAFKELCQKLGLTDKSRVQVLESAAAAAAVAAPLPYNDEEEPYEWDSFTADYGTMKAPNYATTSAAKAAGPPKELLNKRKTLPNPKPKALSTTAARSPSAANVSSAFPKLYKVNQSKWNGAPGSRIVKPIKENKAQRWHNSTGGLAAIGTAFGSGASTSAASKKPTDVKENRLIPSYLRSKPHKLAETTAKPNGITKIETSRIRPPMSKSQVEQVNKIIKSNKSAATTSRAAAAAMGQAQKSKSTSPGTQRVLPPRSTHASQMRQTEVKRRLNLMRSENETDVQVNQYLFK